jgi:hypothetical protein
VGRRGFRGCRGHAGAATHVRSPSPAPSSSSENEWEFEFIIVLNGYPLGIQRLSNKFGEFIAGNKSTTLQLREASCGFCRWPVDVLLHTIWEKFVPVQNLQAGCVLTFRYEGDDKMSVMVFDDTSCRRHYHTDNEEDDD